MEFRFDDQLFIEPFSGFGLSIIGKRRLSGFLNDLQRKSRQIFNPLNGCIQLVSSPHLIHHDARFNPNLTGFSPYPRVVFLHFPPWRKSLSRLSQNRLGYNAFFHGMKEAGL